MRLERGLFEIGPLSNGPHSFAATASDAAGNTSAFSSPFNVTVNPTEDETLATLGLMSLGLMSTVIAAPSLSIDDTSDHLINATESTAVAFTVSGLSPGATGAVTFSDASNHQVVVGVGGDGTFSANLSGLTDGTITSLLSATGPSGDSTRAIGNAVSLDTDSGLDPTLSVNAANPSDVIFTVSGLESDYSGTVSFTDTTGKSDVVAIGSNGTYSANLSNLTNGALTYLMTVSDPAGNVIQVDPTTTLGDPWASQDGSLNAPAGTPQMPNLLNGMAVRPPWEVAGVDYAVGIPAGAVLKDPSTINMSGVTVNTASHKVTVSTNNTTISGIDFSLDGGWQLVVAASNVTVTDCNFAVGTNAQPMLNISSGSNTLLEYCQFNGNSIDQSTLNGVVYASSAGTGAVTVQYCYFENGSEDWVDSPNGAPITLQYNLFDNNGQGGGHPDWLQMGGGNISAVVEYNTYVQSALGAGGGSQGIGLYDGYSGSYNLTSATVSNNTIVTLPGVQVNYIIHIGYSGTIVGGGTGGLTGTATIQNNYVDMAGTTGSFFSAQSGSGSTPQAGASVVESGNVNMVTGGLFSQINPPAVTLTSIVESPSSGDVTTGSSVTLTLILSAAVTVAGGTPTLTLNDGGTATYTGGSGTSALTFSYTVAAGQNTARPGGDRGQSQRRDHQGRCRQCRQPLAHRSDPDRAADRHHGADGSTRIGGVALERRPQCRQVGHADAQPERGRDGCRRHADPHAQRRRHRDLHGRLRHQCADLQLHGGGRAEHRRPCGDRGQSQRRHHHRWRRQCRQPVADRSDPDRPADRHHGADDQLRLRRRPRAATSMPARPSR